MKGDEFWDYDQQVDLEAFSTKDFYSTLAKQTSDVTAALARQKDQVCSKNICNTLEKYYIMKEQF